MGHWTAHAFHVAVVSPRMMYDDVTMGFSDGALTFSGRPLANWRAWIGAGLVARLAITAVAVVAFSSLVPFGRLSTGLTSDLLLRGSGVVAAWMIALWVADRLLTRLVRDARHRSRERVARIPVGDVSRAKLSGRTLVLRAPFDPRNGSDRWRLRLDSHDQGESLLALIGRR